MTKLEQAVERASCLTPLEIELRDALRRVLHANPVYRGKPVGSPGSIARLAQEDAIAAEDAGLTALSHAAEIEANRKDRP